MPKKVDVGTPASQASAETRLVLGRPITIEIGKSKSDKRKWKGTSSRGTRRMTDIERRVTKSLRRVTRAFDHGVDTYIDHRDRSKERRRDGAVVDFFENVSYGLSTAVSEASPVLQDVGEALNTRRMRRQIRQLSRGFSSIPLIG